MQLPRLARDDSTSSSLTQFNFVGIEYFSVVVYLTFRDNDTIPVNIIET